MYLSHLAIRNFRAIRKLDVNLYPGLNVLVGRNNTGKTTLLQAIQYGLGPSASHGDSFWIEEDDFFRSSAQASRAAKIEIVLTFSDLDEAQRAFFFEIVDFDLEKPSLSRAVVRFEASLPQGKTRALIKRVGGMQNREATEVPSSILQALQVTYLPALRDAEAALTPGYKNRLAKLLQSSAERKNDGPNVRIAKIFEEANAQLGNDVFIQEVVTAVQAITEAMAGTDAQSSTIQAADADFLKILRTLQVQMDDSPIGSLSSNGLGFNNLLYIAVVLQHLSSSPTEDVPLLLVEEPEAHLHPQLTLLLGNYLSDQKDKVTQTLVTTHSPALASYVLPSQVHLLFKSPHAPDIRCHSLKKANMSDSEERGLQRMMDVTKATLYFAKGALLVEGISEALLFPILAQRLGINLAKEHVSVIPICGVAFETFRRLLAPEMFEIPVSIVTDSDPEVERQKDWRAERPEKSATGFDSCDRTKKLMDSFREHPTVHVARSQVTLEYDLALAGDSNAKVMALAWEGCYERKPQTLNQDLVEEAKTTEEKALVVWGGICRSSATVGKADFAHQLALLLSKKAKDGTWAHEFTVPLYIATAIRFVVDKLKPATIGA